MKESESAVQILWSGKGLIACLLLTESELLEVCENVFDAGNIRR